MVSEEAPSPMLSFCLLPWPLVSRTRGRGDLPSSNRQGLLVNSHHVLNTSLLTGWNRGGGLEKRTHPEVWGSLKLGGETKRHPQNNTRSFPWALPGCSSPFCPADGAHSKVTVGPASQLWVSQLQGSPARW